jgi:hypothetical protein
VHNCFQHQKQQAGSTHPQVDAKEGPVPQQGQVACTVQHPAQHAKVLASRLNEHYWLANVLVAAHVTKQAFMSAGRYSCKQYLNMHATRACITRTSWWFAHCRQCAEHAQHMHCHRCC